MTAICPGPTDTPFARKMAAALPDPEAAVAAFSARMPLERRAGAEERANAIAYLASEEAPFITGSILDVDGGSNLVTAPVGPGSFAGPDAAEDAAAHFGVGAR